MPGMIIKIVFSGQINLKPVYKILIKLANVTEPETPCQNLPTCISNIGDRLETTLANTLSPVSSPVHCKEKKLVIEISSFHRTLIHQFSKEDAKTKHSWTFILFPSLFSFVPIFSLKFVLISFEWPLLNSPKGKSSLKQKSFFCFELHRPIITDLGAMPQSYNEMTTDEFEQLLDKMPHLKVMTISPHAEASHNYNRIKCLLRRCHWLIHLWKKNNNWNIILSMITGCSVLQV